MSDRVSVTEVRNALRCPRLFALGRSLGRSVSFPVGSSCLGASFHRVVERFAQTVSVPPARFAQLPSSAARDELEAQLCDWLLELLIDELEQDMTYASMPGEVDDLAEALRELARHLSARLDPFTAPPAQALSALMHSGEQAIEARLNGTGPIVSGRLDALYADERGRIDVIEYKLTDEANDEVDRAQAALYREILRAVHGVDARPVVLRFSPLLREVSMRPEHADEFLRTRVLPVVERMPEWASEPALAPETPRQDLCAACPVARECKESYPARLAARDDPPVGATRPRPGLSTGLCPPEPLPQPDASDEDAAGHREAAALSARILDELRRQGTSAVCPHAPIVGPTLYLIQVARPRGAVRHLDSAAEDVRHRLASEDGVELEYEKRGGHRRFVVRRPQPRSVRLSSLLLQRRQFLAERPGRFIVGQCPDGEVLCGDLADASTPHLLVAGQSGSGKSVLLQSVIASLVQYHPPSAIRFTLVDPKRVTFNGAAFRGAVSAHLDGPVRSEIEYVLPVLEQLIQIMEERYRLFERAQVSDIGELNEQLTPPERLERRVLVIDEFQDLITDKASTLAFFDSIRRLGAKARAAGIHLILATQRPDRNVVPPIIRANLGGKVALQVASATNSRIILDEGGAEKLLGKGDLLANLGRGVVRAQGPMLG
jgi:DNA segregation ATPase FtsK/SpoIIIE, S-DNA-T family